MQCVKQRYSEKRVEVNVKDCIFIKYTDNGWLVI